MSSNCQITDLPSEIIAYILEFSNIKISDVIHLSMTCKKLYKIINEENTLWKKKFFQSWPWMKYSYKRILHCYFKILCWRVIWRQSIKIITELNKLIKNNDSSEDLFMEWRKLNYLELKKIDDLFDTDKGAPHMAFELIKHELMEKHSHHYMFGRYRYYRNPASQILKHIVKIHVAKAWKKFIKLPAEKQIVEKYSIWTFQMMKQDTDMPDYRVSKFLDRLTDKTKKKLKESWPSHPLFSTPKETFDTWRMCTISDNQWDAEDSRRILSAMCHTVFKEVCKKGISRMEYTYQLSLTERDLKYCYKSPLYLSIIFEGVGRRLGVRCCGVCYFGSFFLKWNECYKRNKDCDIFYVDFFKGGRFLKKINVPSDESRIGEYPIRKKQDFVKRYFIGVASTEKFCKEELSSLNCNAKEVKSLLKSLFRIEVLQDDENISEVAKFYLNATMIHWSLETLIIQATINKENEKFSEMCEEFALEMEFCERYLVNFKDSGIFEF